MDLTQYDLIIFDVDGTLVESFTDRLLPGRRAFFAALALLGPVGVGPQIALASNQGGVGLRFWMEKEGWGDPAQYPTRAEAEERVYGVAREIGPLYSFPAVYICFAYQASDGRWSPTPEEAYDRPGLPGLDPRWSVGWRKPAPGMLLQAMEDADVISERVLMVGDRDEDKLAAERAGCAFASADEFFAPYMTHGGFGPSEEDLRRRWNA